MPTLSFMKLAFDEMSKIATGTGKMMIEDNLACTMAEATALKTLNMQLRALKLVTNVQFRNVLFSEISCNRIQAYLQNNLYFNQVSASSYA